MDRRSRSGGCYSSSPSLDAEDQPATDTYTDADLDALDAAIALDENDATTAGIAENSESLTTRRVTIPMKYAPKGWIHQDETQFPFSPNTWFKHSDLMWYAGDPCGRYDMDATPDPDDLGAGEYRHQRVVYDGHGACPTTGDTYTSIQNVRPGDAESDVGSQGMYLNLNNDYRDGQGFGHDEPVWYEYEPKQYLIYWFTWGNSYEQYGRFEAGTHEGDWERMAIKLDSVTNTPVRVQYFYHKDSCTLRWGDAPRRRDHLKLWFAKNAHGVYPAGGRPYHKSIPVLDDYYDQISDNGGQSYIWYASKVLLPVKSQDWYRYGGAWGDKYGSLGGQWGPMGPNHRHAKTPPTFKAPACQFGSGGGGGGGGGSQ